jgi:DNA-binding MarR family transcriptional regulator
LNRVLDALRSFQSAQSAALHRASDALGISQTALGALQTLVNDPDPEGLTMKDFAQNVGVSPAVLTGIVDKLEEKGWIRRQLHSTDRRSTVVVPTVGDDSEVLRVLHALDAPMRRVANSIPDDVAAVVRTMTADMESELRRFDPEAAMKKRSE